MRRGNERRDNTLRDAIGDARMGRERKVEGRSKRNLGELGTNIKGLLPLRAGDRVQSSNTSTMDTYVQPVVLVTGASRYVLFVAHRPSTSFKPNF